MTTRSSVSPNGTNGKRAPAPELVPRILKCLAAVQDGNFAVRLPSDWTGLEGKVADSLNEIIAANERMARELRTRQPHGRQARQNRPAGRLQHGRRRLAGHGGIAQFADLPTWSGRRWK